MPSLPTSLIVVGLVAAWLVVLVPMVAKRREHVPESDEDSAGFRVLRRATALRRRRPVLSRTAVAAGVAEDAADQRDDDPDGMERADDEWGSDEWDEPAGADRFDEDSGGEDFGAEGSGDEDFGDEGSGDEDFGDEVRAVGVAPDAADDDAVVVMADGDEVDGRGSEGRGFGDGGDAVDDGADAAGDDLIDARPDDVTAEREDAADRRRAPVERVLDRRRDPRADRGTDRSRRVRVAADEEPRVERWGRGDDPRHRPAVRDAADEWSAEHPDRARRQTRPASDRPADRPIDRQAERPARWQREPDWDDQGARAPVRGRSAPAADDPQFRPVPVRPGRGGYDPEAAEQAKAYRYGQRRRVVVVLLALMVAGAAAGVLGFTLAWVGMVLAGVLLALYLAYLRRQVRIEETIRKRRAARLERARQIRPVYRPSVAEQVRVHRTGGLRRPDLDEEPVAEYRVTSHARPATASVPPVYRARGVPVDLDDDDPAFDDLEYYRPVTYRRAAGE